MRNLKILFSNYQCNSWLGACRTNCLFCAMFTWMMKIATMRFKKDSLSLWTDPWYPKNKNSNCRLPWPRVWQWKKHEQLLQRCSSSYSERQSASHILALCLSQLKSVWCSCRWMLSRSDDTLWSRSKTLPQCVHLQPAKMGNFETKRWLLSAQHVRYTLVCTGRQC